MLIGLRRTLRRRLSASQLQMLAQVRRVIRDRVTLAHGDLVRTAPSAAATAEYLSVITIRQPIRQSAHWQGKVDNLVVASSRLSHVLVPAGRIVSFWHLVGPPTVSNGFRTGRAIRGDVLTADIGGGLCQISGLLYELGLRAGLDIVERHPHTQDLYTEESRFTPLGLDATVVWGHKDVRLRNTADLSIAFHFEVAPAEILGSLLASGAMGAATIDIVRRDAADGRHVEVRRARPGQGSELISRDLYRVATAG